MKKESYNTIYIALGLIISLSVIDRLKNNVSQDNFALQTSLSILSLVIAVAGFLYLFQKIYEMYKTIKSP